MNLCNLQNLTYMYSRVVLKELPETISLEKGVYPDDFMLISPFHPLCFLIIYNSLLLIVCVVFCFWLLQGSYWLCYKIETERRVLNTRSSSRKIPFFQKSYFFKLIIDLNIWTNMTLMREEHTLGVMKMYHFQHF